VDFIIANDAESGTRRNSFVFSTMNLVRLLFEKTLFYAKS